MSEGDKHLILLIYGSVKDQNGSFNVFFAQSMSCLEGNSTLIVESWYNNIIPNTLKLTINNNIVITGTIIGAIETKASFLERKLLLQQVPSILPSFKENSNLIVLIPPPKTSCIKAWATSCKNKVGVFQTA